MRRTLSEMTLEELWQLFPISLTAPDERWKSRYAEMEEKLKAAFSGIPIRRISHIGSTAIGTIWAKDIVDILVEIEPGADMEKAASVAEDVGFLRMSEEENRISMNYGYTENGFSEKVYHLHLRFSGDNDELYFRDYMTQHPELAKAYESLKLELWKRFEHDRDGYTNAKTEFIRSATAKARAAFGNRY